VLLASRELHAQRGVCNTYAAGCVRVRAEGHTLALRCMHSWHAVSFRCPVVTLATLAWHAHAVRACVYVTTARWPFTHPTSHHDTSLTTSFDPMHCLLHCILSLCAAARSLPADPLACCPHPAQSRSPSKPNRHGWKDRSCDPV
jgi:hypothetical protein